MFSFIKSFFKILLIFSVASFLIIPFAFCLEKTGAEQGLEQVEKIKDRIEDSKGQIDALKKRESGIVKKFNRTDKALAKARKDASICKTGLASLEKRINRTEASVQRLKDDIAARKAYAARRMKTIYKLEWTGRLQLMAKADSVKEFFQTKKYLEYILASDKSSLASLLVRDRELAALLNDLKNKTK
ncbi:hypothetical protein QUF76_17095, partial [Desulfobacterales bacterium HSG16]|nr:hypothetical protein [Desulfobacterales bacterium HSG16]